MSYTANNFGLNDQCAPCPNHLLRSAVNRIAPGQEQNLFYNNVVPVASTTVRALSALNSANINNQVLTALDRQQIVGYGGKAGVALR